MIYYIINCTINKQRNGRELAMNITVAIIFLIGAFMMLLASGLRGDLTKRQMKINGLTGHSCLSHTGVWGDILLIPWLAGIMAQYHHQWGSVDWIWLGAIGTIITYMMHAIWAHCGPPDHNVAPPDKLTLAGWLHFVFMSAMMSLIILFYFTTDNIDPQHLLWITIFLSAHCALSTAVLEWRRQGHPTWVGIGTTLVVWAILFWRLYYELS